jgi:hypothetical protein
MRAARAQSASDRAGERSWELIGAASGRTLNDANLLGFGLDYGVPMVGPVEGRFIAWSVAVWDGCTLSALWRYGAISFVTPEQGCISRTR